MPSVSSFKMLCTICTIWTWNEISRRHLRPWDVTRLLLLFLPPLPLLALLPPSAWLASLPGGDWGCGQGKWQRRVPVHLSHLSHQTPHHMLWSYVTYPYHMPHITCSPARSLTNTALCVKSKLGTAITNTDWFSLPTSHDRHLLQSIILVCLPCILRHWKDGWLPQKYTWGQTVRMNGSSFVKG